MERVELRISKARAFLAAALFILVTVFFTPWMLEGVATEAAFERMQAENAGDRRCLVCDAVYRPYQALTWAAVLFFNGLFGSASLVGLWRSVGPPTLVIHSDGRGRYVLPWRIRAFRVPENTTIRITRFGLAFQPALEDEDTGKPLASINIRSFWTNRSAGALADDLHALNSSWTITR